MTETRQQIIELIEPYMDKSLSVGCLFIYMWELHKARIWWDVINLEDLEVEDTDLLYMYNEYTEEHRPKILWHYDITAVLKHIQEYFEIRLCDIWEYFELYQNWWIIDYDIKIPNKPLHLYTQQEEKELLELLTKLNNG